MIFRCTPPDMMTFLQGGSAWKIFAEGEIDADAGNRLEKALLQNHVPSGSQIYINSNGGSLVGGLDLGRVIRNRALVSYVGKEGKFEKGFQFHESGSCMSAAAIAYLGGQHRFIDLNSLFGVHRFSLASGDKDNVDYAQMLSATVIEYIQSMGISTELFALAADVPADDILIVPHETLRRLRVVNDGQGATIWTIEALKEGLYLKGARETVYGIQKFLVVFPSEGDPYLHVIFDGGELVEQIMDMGADRIAINDEFIDLSSLRISRLIDNGNINCIYKLNSEIMSKIQKAQTVGYVLQHSEGAAVYVGFESMPFDAGLKLQGLLEVFHRSDRLTK